jgi:O-acetylserine/cysteine efflux transporter
MSLRDAMIGTAVAIAWGLNFVAIGAGLEDLPPLLFVALRFLLAALPVLPFVGRPGVGLRPVVALGLLAGVGQFGFLFLGVAAGMPSGLSSVVVQAQLPFTVLLAVVLLGERPRAPQVVGLAVAICGLVVIALHRGDEVPIEAVALVVAGGASWAGANVLARSLRGARPFALLVHSSLVSGGCMLALSLAVEGPGRDLDALGGMGPRAALSLAYIVVVATLAGYGAWYWLLGRYPSSTVSGFPLLAPVAGLSSTWLLLGEEVSVWQLAGSVLVVGGVGLAIWCSGRGTAVPVTITPDEGSMGTSTVSTLGRPRS